MGVTRRQLLAVVATGATLAGSGLVISSAGLGEDRPAIAGGEAEPTETRTPTPAESTPSVLAADTGAGGIVGELSVSDGTIFTDDGFLKSLTVSLAGEVRYDGLERAANSVDLQLFAAPADSDLSAVRNRIAQQSHLVSEDSSMRAHAGAVNYEFVDVDVLGAADLEPGAFSAADGESTTTTVALGLLVVVRDTSGAVIIHGSIDTSTAVTVVNEPEGGETSGNGSITGGGSDEEP